MVNVKALNDEIMGRWKVKLIRQNASPVVLIGVGHDKNEGVINIFISEKKTKEEIKNLLAYAFKHL
jgi:hypothetical protein